MTNPDREELIGYADSLNQQADWIEAALAPETPDSQRIGIEDIDIDELRSAAESLRRLASSDGGVKVRELEWVERTGVAGTFDASTSIGHYIASITDEGRGHWFIVGQTTSNYTIDDIDVVKAEAYLDYESRIRSALVEVPSVKGDPEPVAWHDGAPPKPWADEWFIAETIYHERVVLRSLPEEYTYDFKTADETYIKAANIKRWMQFPESEYTAKPADAGMREALELAHGKFCKIAGTEAWTDSCLDGWRRSPGALRDYAEQAAKEIDATLTAPSATTKSDGEIGHVRFSGPAVDALDRRKESDDGPTEDQVTADARRFIAENGPSIKSSDPLAGKVPCHCHDAVSVRLCLDRSRCYVVEAQPVQAIKMPEYHYQELDMSGDHHGVTSNYSEYTPVTVRGSTSDPSSTRSEVTAIVDREWQSLLDKDDRTSPEEYPDMCLITREELHGVVNAALLETHQIRRK